jgi:drug/metabolite transporter (DMT)-like permease
VSDRRDREGIALSIVAAAGFGAMAVLAKLAYASGAGVLEVLTIRFAIAAAVLGALTARRPAPPRPAARHLAAGLALGALCYAAESGLFFASLTRLPAGLAELLLYAYPALVVGGAVLLGREAFSRRRAVALAVATVGIALVLLGGGGVRLDPVGVALALGAALAYTAYILLAGHLGRAVPPLRMAALVSAGAAGSFAVAGLALGQLHFAFGVAGWAWIAAIALVSTVLPLTAFLAGMERLGAGKASILSTLEPPVTVGFAFLAFGDTLAPGQLAGGLLVVGSVVVLQARLASRRHADPPLPTRRATARTFALRAARGGRVGLRTQVGRLPGPGLRRS